MAGSLSRFFFVVSSAAVRPDEASAIESTIYISSFSGFPTAMVACSPYLLIYIDILVRSLWVLVAEIALSSEVNGRLIGGHSFAKYVR